MVDSTRTRFEDCGQGHVFRFFDQLSASEQASLLAQAESIDLDELQGLVQSLVLKKDTPTDSSEGISPAPFVPLPDHGGNPALWQKAREQGEAALRAGRVAAFTPAGGQGTRLGYDGPKGTFAVTPVTGKSLFQVFAEKIRASSRRFGVDIPWYIMTSDGNHEATISFFEENGYFGLNPQSVWHFPQGTMPAVDFEGKIILSEKGSMALSPDGHGGSLRALVRNGCIDDMKKRGIDCVAFFQVDNPLVRCVHPEFIGFHVMMESELSSKACLKAYAAEKVGVFVEQEGKTRILEYSDLPEELAQATTPEGDLLFRAGSIAIHVFNRNLIERIGTGSDPSIRLPFHRADKIVPFVNDEGTPVQPEKPNGIKFEMFGFDALPFARNPVVIETARRDEFSPVKNAQGVDSPKSSREDQLRLFARWARSVGMEIESDASGLPTVSFEISPLFALDEEQFKERFQAGEIPPIQEGLVC